MTTKLEHSERIGEVSGRGQYMEVFMLRRTTLSEDLLTVVKHETAAIQLLDGRGNVAVLTRSGAEELAELLYAAVNSWTEPVGAGE